MRSLIIGAAAIACILAGCTGGGDGRDTTSTSTDPAVIKKDYVGDIRVPQGAALIRVMHTDPYRWTAELTFTGPAEPVVADFLDQLTTTLDFEFGIQTRPFDGVCDEGAVDPTGPTSCKIRGYLAGDRGYIYVEVLSPRPTDTGTLRIERIFQHRGRTDVLGPPYPED